MAPTLRLLSGNLSGCSEFTTWRVERKEPS